MGGYTHRALRWVGRLAGGPAVGAHTDPYRLRRWFAFFIVWLAALTIIAVTAFGRYERGHPHAQGVWLVGIAMFYLSLCCLFFPAPTAWIVMLLASNQVQLLESVPARVLTVSCLCGLATAMANLNEYHVVTFILRYGWVARVRRTRVYRVTARWFSAAPFLVIVTVGFLPIPVDVVRWLAITYRYSRWRFFVAYFLGRSPRYAIFAISVVWLDLIWWQILVVQAALVLAAVGKVVHTLLQRRAAQAAEGALSMCKETVRCSESIETRP
jgi:membrane protein YqaA with SNARE-associated domain